MGRAAVLALAALVCVGCADGRTAKPTQPPDLYVLTAANELVGATVAGRVVARRQLARARRPSSPSPRLALDRDRLFVLVRRDAPPDRLVVLDPANMRIIVSRPLPSDVRARVVVGGSGRVVVAGNRVARRLGPGLFEEDAVVLELDRAAKTLRRFTVREANGHDWWVTSAALSPDASRLAVSYHGGCDERAPQLCTGGADVVDLARTAREQCVEPYPRSGCVEAHGHVEFFGDRLLAAKGSGQVQVVGGATLDTRLGNSHVMDFALDRGRGEVAVAAPCQHFGGLSIVDLATGAARLLARPAGPNARVCGTRVALLPGLVAVAPIGTAVAHPRGAGRVLLVERATGRLRARIPLRAEPVDVFAVRSSG